MPFYKNETTQCISNRESVNVYETGVKSDSTVFFFREELNERNILTNFNTNTTQACAHIKSTKQSS